MPLRARRGGGGSFSPAIACAEPVDRRVEAAGEVAGLERRRDLLADDAAGRARRESRPSSVAATWMLTRGRSWRRRSGGRRRRRLRPIFQSVGDALRERGDVFRPRRRHDQHHDLRAVRLVSIDCELGAQRLRLRRASSVAGLVDRRGRQRGHRHDVLATAPPNASAERGDERGDSAAKSQRIGRRRRVRTSFAQRDAGLSKSRSAAPRSALRSATVKFGLSL